MPATPPLSLELVPSWEKELLREWLDDYLAELDAMAGVRSQLDDHHHVPYPYWDAYWQEPGRFPLTIWLGDELAGFCLLRDTGKRWQIAEFYIEPERRRGGVGAAAVAAIKDLCRAAGRHTELEASTLPFNTGALAFWRRQGFVTASVEPDRTVNVFTLA